MKKVYIILVNYNNYDDTIACVKSLNKIKYKEYKIVIVDNASTNDSVKVLRADKSLENSVILPLKENLGFSGGNNYGIEYALKDGADFVLMLNNDTEVDENFLDYLVQYANERTVTISKIYYYDEPTMLWYDGGDMCYKKGTAMHRNKGKLDNNSNDTQTYSCTFATGCCMLIHKNIIESIGYLENDFFMYCEDVEYCVRLLKQNVEIRYVPASKIYHKVGSTGGGEYSPMSTYYATRNRFYLIKRHSDVFGMQAYIFTYLSRIAKICLSFVKGNSMYKYISMGMRDYKNKITGYKKIV